MNNAAYQHHQESIEAITDEQFDRTFRTNIYGYMYMARAAVAWMKRGSAVVNTGSITGLQESGGLLDLIGDQGRNPRVYEVACAESRGARRQVGEEKPRSMARRYRGSVPASPRR